MQKQTPRSQRPNSIDISKIGMSSTGQNKVSTQLMNVIIHHSKLVRYTDYTGISLHANDWAEKEIKSIIRRYFKVIGVKRTKININVVDVLINHSNETVDNCRKSMISISDIKAEEELKNIIDNYFISAGVEEKHLFNRKIEHNGKGNIRIGDKGASRIRIR